MGEAVGISEPERDTSDDTSVDSDSTPADAESGDAAGAPGADMHAATATPSLPVVRPYFEPAAPPRRPGETTMSYYVRWARTAPMLTPEEEKRYTKAYAETQDPEAANLLVSSHMRLVLKIAMQYQRHWADIIDLVQEGTVGLIQALDRFDLSRGVPFSAYARHWIRAMIFRYLMENFHLVKYGSTRAGRKLFLELGRERNRLIAEGIVPKNKMLSERLGVSERDIERFDNIRSGTVSLDTPSGDSDDSRTLAETLPDPLQDGPEVGAAKRELSDRLRVALDSFRETLTAERDIVIWEERLLNTDPTSLADLGRRYEVSRERMRQIEARLKKKLKVHLEKTLGDEVAFEFDTDNS